MEFVKNFANPAETNNHECNVDYTYGTCDSCGEMFCILCPPGECNMPRCTIEGCDRMTCFRCLLSLMFAGEIQNSVRIICDKMIEEDLSKKVMLKLILLHMHKDWNCIVHLYERINEKWTNDEMIKDIANILSHANIASNELASTVHEAPKKPKSKSNIKKKPK